MKRSVIICFLGSDGSGKSTLAKYLCSELRRANYRTTYVWWLKGERSLLRRTLKALFTRPGLQTGVKQEGPAVKREGVIGRLFSSLYPIIPIADYVRFGVVHAWIPKLRGNNVMIFDRFMYDVIWSLSDEFKFEEAKRTKLFQLCTSLVPRPDLIFMVDVPAELSYERKRDEIASVEEAQQKREAYQKLYFVLQTSAPSSVVRIDNSGDLAAAKEAILDATFALIKGD